MNRELFSSNEASGIFQTGEAYQQWSAWAEDIKTKIHILNDRYLCLSSLPKENEYRDIIEVCNQNLESAIHVIFSDMNENQISWLHFILLHRLLDFTPVPDEDRGRFSRFVQHWYKWYSDELYRY